MPVKNKVDGISGDSQVCTLLPYEIISMEERPVEPPPSPTPTPTPEEPKPPVDNELDTFKKFILKLIELLKKLFKL